jgi:ribosome-associated protein
VSDAQSHALALALASAAADVKCVDISALNVSSVVNHSRYLVLATAFSRPQVAAALDKCLVAAGQEGLGRTPYCVPEPSSWVCLDFGDVVCHLFTPEQKEFYKLPQLYAKAVSVPLPFATAQA